MGRCLRFLAALLAACCCLAPIAQAQTTTGRISGTVTDASGAVLPGVTVAVTEATTGLTKTAVTDSRGGYVLIDLPRGTYNVSAELTGFKKGVKNGYALVADGRVTVNFALGVGNVSESIEVTADEVAEQIQRLVDADPKNAARVRQHYASAERRRSLAESILERKALELVIGASQVRDEVGQPAGTGPTGPASGAA